MSRIDIYALDTETTGTDPDTDSLLEIAVYGEEQWSMYSSLVEFAGDIPAAAKAVHHIKETWVRHAASVDHVMSKIDDILCNSQPEERVLVAHNAAFDKAFLDDWYHEENWLCTMRMAKHLFPGLESYGLQFLRYQLGVRIEPEPDGAPHRALYDTICTYFLCKHLYAASVDQGLDVFSSVSRAVEWCWSPILLKSLTFGKHAGVPFEQIPKDYLHWMMRQENSTPGSWDEDTVYTIQQYI